MKSVWYKRYGKRLFDLVLTIPGLVVISPLLAVIALLVRVKLGSPVLFKQQRPGLDGKPFIIYKFRTMTDERDTDGNLLPDGERLTRLGQLLRSTSLDELPELINVLKGEMSLVGPRPLLMEYLPFYTEREQLRHKVRPGITGLAQISGRNFLYWDNRLEFDAQYVESYSFLNDVTIIMKTLWKVLKRSDVSKKPGKLFGNLDKCRYQKLNDKISKEQD